MEDDTGWAEKAKRHWAEYRAAFETYVPDAERKTSEEIARLQEDRRRYMDFVERNYAGVSDSELLHHARGYWYMIEWAGCVSLRDLDHYRAIEAVLESRGYDIDEQRTKWHSEAVARTRTTVDRMVTEGGLLERVARAALAEATNEGTGIVDWAMVDHALLSVGDEGNGLDDATMHL